MPEQKCESWQDFRNKVLKLIELRKDPWIFRGQGDATWELEPTLDRRRSFEKDFKRKAHAKKLLKAFKIEAMGLRHDLSGSSDDEHWLLLGRHHGLPTTVLDWTQSPFVAAFFAFSDVTKNSKNVAVWALNQLVFDQESIFDIDVYDSPDLLWFNPRAIEQRALCLEIKSRNFNWNRLKDKLVRFEIPVTEREKALRELDLMLINARTLFRDLDGAARSATTNVDLRPNDE